MTRIACQQLAPELHDLEANRALTGAAIEQAVAAGADVVVLPELISCGYMFQSAAEAASAAITTDHPLIAGWVQAAVRADIVLAAGFCERGDDGLTYNSAVLIDGTGLRAVYRKLHLWDREKLWFAPGNELPPVIDTRVGRVSMLICYDLEFPELTRTVALAGTQLLLVPTNWPLMPRPDGERPAEVGIAMATARMNRMAVACADRLGTERGQAWTGGTTIVDPDGWAAAETRESGMIVADIDLDAARDKHYTELADAHADRRPELYGAVTRSATSSAHASTN
ncbi:MAG TPA: nitrilase-related carbon-nitrogen hydrolase [Solirubrobacteraceae bacterium]|nr:nitrilase-related carbon-nitrogen hydrolase [Solirubrobacteraceae bacterium]